MATVTKAANANQTVLETVAWGTPTNAYVNDTTAATNTPSAKSQSNTRSWGFPAFTTTDIPGGALITAVTLRYTFLSSTTSSASAGAVLGVQGENGSIFGSETIEAMTLTATTHTKDLTAGVALADLRTANLVRARFRSNRSTSNTGITWSLRYVELQVDFTPATVNNDSASGTLTLSGSRTESWGKSFTDSTSGSFALSGSSVDDFHPPAGTTFTGSASGTLTLNGSANV